MEDMNVICTGSIPDEVLERIAQIFVNVMKKEKAPEGDQAETSA